MALVRTSCALVLGLATAAGCGQDEILPELADAAVDAEVDAEEWVDPPPPPDYRQTYHAIQMLVALEARLPSLLVNGQFPGGVQGFTPGATCCAAGGVTRCPANPAAWTGLQMWDALQFRIDGSHGYVFSAFSLGGTTLTITARGDLDCDGTFADIVMTCTLPGGVVSCAVEFPDTFE